MKIVGGHDYWDSAAAYGVDQSVTLVRNTNIETPNFESSDFFFPVIRSKNKAFCLGAIMVAGKTYPFVYDTVWDSNNWKTIIYYDFSELVEKYPDLRVRSWDSSYEEDYIWFCNQPAFQEKNVVDFLCEHHAAFALILPVEHTYGGWNWRKTNIPRHAKSKVWINPVGLKAWDFFKVKDSFTMFMEVDQWVTGVLPQTKETVVLSDKSKIIKAGFDYKKSFRKEPE